MKLKQSLAAAAIVCLSGAAHAEPNREHIALALKVAQNAGLKRCDAAIREAFNTAAGKHFRVWYDRMKEVSSDQLRLFGVYGNDGDTVSVDVNIRRVGESCIAFETTSIVADSSCAGYLSDNPAWKTQNTTADVIGAKNAGGINALLRPAGRQCVVTFYRGFDAPAN